LRNGGSCRRFMQRMWKSPDEEESPSAKTEIKQGYKELGEAGLREMGGRPRIGHP